MNNLAIYLLLAILGLFFWNCAFTSIAVTINDPNSSTRSSLMFLPLMFVAMGFPGLQTPDARIMKALSVLPGTSPTVMTARLVLSDVAAWEVAMAVGLMVLSILLLRYASRAKSSQRTSCSRARNFLGVNSGTDEARLSL